MATIDHYKILGLPTGIQGTKLTPNEISKAFRSKALQLHPDKHPENSNANTEFRNLKSSYDILMDDKSRKVFDSDILSKMMEGEEWRRNMSKDAERRKVAQDLEKMDADLKREEAIRKMAEDLERQCKVDEKEQEEKKKRDDRDLHSKKWRGFVAKHKCQFVTTF